MALSPSRPLARHTPRHAPSPPRPCSLGTCCVCLGDGVREERKSWTPPTPSKAHTQVAIARKATPRVGLNPAVIKYHTNPTRQSQRTGKRTRRPAQNDSKLGRVQRARVRS